MELSVLLSISLPIILGFLCVFFASKDRVVFHAHGLLQQIFLFVLMVAPVFTSGLILAGFRPENVGFDTPRYVATFLNLDGVSTAREVGESYYGNTEFLLWPFQSLLKPFLSVRGWLVVNYCLIFLLVYIYYRSATKILRLSSAIFALVFLTFFLVYAGNTMRQALAIPIGALGFHLYRRGKASGGLFAIAIAIGFHWSSVMLLAAPAFSLKLFKRDRVYLLIPLLALLSSMLLMDVVGFIVGAINIPALTDRFDLYFAEGRVSHVGNVWEKANFWICSITSFAFLYVCKPGQYKDTSLHQYVMLFLALIFFGITNADFSERYMPYILLVIPLLMAMITDKLPLPAFAKNFLFLGYFLALGALVFTSSSSQLTLGYYF